MREFSRWSLPELVLPFFLSVDVGGLSARTWPVSGLFGEVLVEPEHALFEIIVVKRLCEEELMIFN
jgi:hypothetical protein